MDPFIGDGEPRSRDGGKGILSCKILFGNHYTPPSLVAYFYSCSGESEDNQIRYNLRNRIILSDFREGEGLGLGVIIQ